MAILVTPSDLAIWLGQTAPDKHAVPVCDAVNSYLDTYPHIADPEPKLLPQYRLGATMMAARLHRRRNSPAGIESTEIGASWVPRSDPDIARLLGIDGGFTPIVG